MTDESDVPVVAPEEAIAFFRAKGFQFGFAWADVWQWEHARAFTVAKAITRDVLETIREAVDRAIAEGETIDTFRRELEPRLQALGWWGRKRMIDPLTAQAKTVQLGSPRRLRTIFRVNMRTAYAAGKWERFERQKDALPFLEYVSVRDGRERPEHRRWHGTIRPVGDGWWDTHYPPCDWECRCSARALSARMMERRGKSVTAEPVGFPAEPWTNKRTGEVHQVERGIGPGWSYNVGKAALTGHAPPPLPGSFDGADVASARDAAAALRPFFAAFGIEAADAPRGRVVKDADGWPLAVSLAWFQRDGRLVLPAPGRRARLGAAGEAIARPSEIRWVWVRGADGAAMLMRRYWTAACVVDVGRAGWRFVAAGEAELGELRRGALAWSAEEAAIAGANPHQTRYGRGGPKGGQFKATHGPELRASLVSGGPAVRKAVIGRVSDNTAARTAEIGIDTRGRNVGLTHGVARKVLKKHGPPNNPHGPGERQQDHLPITIGDLMRGAKLLNASSVAVDPRDRVGGGGEPRFTAQARVGRRMISSVWQVSKRDVALVTMHATRIGKRRG